MTLYHCHWMPLSRSLSNPGTHILRNRNHICSGLMFVWPHFHWCWIEPASVGSRECQMCVCAYATLKFSVPRSLCVMHGTPSMYPLDSSTTTRNAMKNTPNCLTALRYCPQTYVGFELFHQTVSQIILPVNPSIQPCQWSPNRNHLSCWSIAQKWLTPAV